MDLEQLAEWSIRAIGEFRTTYEQVCDVLGIDTASGFPHQQPMVFNNGAHGVQLTPPPLGGVDNSTLALRAGFAFAVKELALSQCYSCQVNFPAFVSQH